MSKRPTGSQLTVHSTNHNALASLVRAQHTWRDWLPYRRFQIRSSMTPAQIEQALTASVNDLGEMNFWTGVVPGSRPWVGTVSRNWFYLQPRGSRPVDMNPRVSADVAAEPDGATVRVRVATLSVMYPICVLAPPLLTVLALAVALVGPFALAFLFAIPGIGCAYMLRYHFVERSRWAEDFLRAVIDPRTIVHTSLYR